MKNDLKDSVKETLAQSVLQLKNTREEIRKMNNFANSLERQIIDFVDIYDIDFTEVQGLKIKEVFEPKEVTFDRILSVFPNHDIELILRNLVGTTNIDLEKTEENLKFSANFPDSIINSVIKQLSKLSKQGVLKVETK